MNESEQVSTLQNRVLELEQEVTRLHETIDYLTKKLFGRSSEKTSVLNVGEMSLFNEAEVEANPKAAEPDIQQVANYRRKKFKGQREELLKDIPHIKKLCSLAEEDRFCERCGYPLVSVGEEFIRTEIEFIPAEIRVIDYYRESFECRPCRTAGESYMEKSPMPYPVIQHSMASPTTVAWVMQQKYVNAMPLYRQEKEWQTLGIELSRATMANWIIVSSRDWLTPLVSRMHEILLTERYIHCDETSVQVMLEAGRKNTTTSYMWVYSSGQYSKHPIRIFEYQPGRSGSYPQKFLKGFQGFLHSDAYSGYNKVSGVTRCFCWAHQRRYFVDALPTGNKSTVATVANQGIEYCNKLFEIERSLKDLSGEHRKVERLKLEKPVLEAFWAWGEAARSQVLPKSKSADALQYALNHKEGLMNYLRDGNCSISNNLVENSIRPFTVGRRNWLFSGSPKGATASAAAYSIVETAKVNGLNPYKYLKFIFSELPGVQFGQHPEFLDDYLPWNPCVQSLCK